MADERSAAPARHVRHFRQSLLWPLQLMPLAQGDGVARHWEVLERAGPEHPWHELRDEFTGDPTQFQERHYREFVAFLPYVQRFLYGEGREGQADLLGASPLRVFRREDVAAVRVTVQADAAPLLLKVAHIDLYFFYDIDVVLLNVEVQADELALEQAQEIMYRFGRAYPPGWEASGAARGRGMHCMHRVEWLGHDGTVRAQSDAGERARFLEFVCRHRAPRVDAHWAWLLAPLVLDHADGADAPGAVRLRQVEYHRMPVMAWLALDDPHTLSRNDFVRLGLVTDASVQEALPYAARHLADFEARFCYDRFWSDSAGGPNTRYLCTGHSLVVIGDARSAFFTDTETGVLAQFRHQHFLLFLIAHFQKAALLMFSDRLVDALRRLDIRDTESVKRFKLTIRRLFETFLRFTHRYWFHEIADQALVKALFHLCAGHLGLDALYAEIKERIQDMNDYLNNDSLRRQANTVVRLTVVTTFGLIGTIATGFLGMNLIAAADRPLAGRILAFVLVIGATSALTLYTLVKSKRLSDFLDALSDERLSARAKLDALTAVWRRRH